MDFIFEVIYQILDWMLQRVMSHPWLASAIAFVLSLGAMGWFFWLVS